MKTRDLPSETSRTPITHNNTFTKKYKITKTHYNKTMQNKHIVIGIDSGTQSTKTLILDIDNGTILATATAAYDLIDGLEEGAKEQNPADWINAVCKSVRQAVTQANIAPADIIAIGVSGQQHGFVPLDAAGQVIRPAKLWCDTVTAPQCNQIMETLGGKDKTIAALGNPVLPGYTAGKILWLKQHEPDNFKRLATVLLPHDYINYWLTGGNAVMEYGDASGTALLDVRARQWNLDALRAIDPDLPAKMPKLISSDQPAGTLCPAAAEAMGIPGAKAIISAGGGDNMMGAIGTGNVSEGVVTASFGTSGTIYACAEKPIIDPNGEIAAFCDSTNRWLPLLCTMNVTVATGMVSDFLGADIAELNRLVNKAPVGSDGVILLPYLEGERTPNVPDGTGVFYGINTKTLRPENLARAAMEGVTLGMNYGLTRLNELGVRATQIRVTGGGSKSPTWRQIMADIFNAEVLTLEVSEGAAYGAAIQALWCYNNANNRPATIQALCNQYIRLNNAEIAKPIPANVAVYQRLQKIQNELSQALRPAFKMSRN